MITIHKLNFSRAFFLRRKFLRVATPRTLDLKGFYSIQNLTNPKYVPKVTPLTEVSFEVKVMKLCVGELEIQSTQERCVTHIVGMK